MTTIDSNPVHISVAWPFSDSPCIRPSSRPMRGVSISHESRYPCRSSRARATNLPNRRSSIRLLERLGSRATLCLLPDADHSFHVPARAALTQAQINGSMLDALIAWIEACIA